MFPATVTTSSGPDGFPVTSVDVDLTHEQLHALGHAATAARVARDRTAALGTDDVLRSRRLTAVGDELAERAANGLTNTVRLTAGDLGVLLDALEDWSAEAEERGWSREDDAAALRLVDASLGDLADLHARALRAALAGPAPAEA